MISMRFLQCCSLMILLSISTVAPSPAANLEHCNSYTQEKRMLLHFDELRKKIDSIESEIKWLQKEQRQCDYELEELRHYIENAC